MSVVLEQVIVHILNKTEAVPIYSNTLLSPNPDLETYLSKTIEKTFYSDDIKNCCFAENSRVWEQCKANSWDVITISQSITRDMFSIIRRNEEISSADLLFGKVEIDKEKYFFMLKLDYKSSYTHFVDSKAGASFVDIIQHQALFPSQPSKVQEAFFIKVDEPVAKVIEQMRFVDGIKDFYLSTLILGCEISKSPRQKTTKLLRVAEKVGQLYYSEEEEIGVHISKTMYEELQKGNVLSVDKLGQRFFMQNPAAQTEFYERLLEADIKRDDELTLSEKFQRKFQKQAIRTQSGVEIRIPTEIYSNADEVEFINNPDGTVSLLIKNIKI